MFGAGRTDRHRGPAVLHDSPYGSNPALVDSSPTEADCTFLLVLDDIGTDDISAACPQSQHWRGRRSRAGPRLLFGAGGCTRDAAEGATLHAIQERRVRRKGGVPQTRRFAKIVKRGYGVRARFGC
jgi:hypothetical protein